MDSIDRADHKATLTQALALLAEVLKSRAITGELPAELAAIPEFTELRETLIDFREFLLAVSVGDLSHSLTRRGYLAGALKTLHASLRHLTWQTSMIAAGDFSQRVDFMGEFSESFNRMVQQLDESRQQLEIASRTDPLTGAHNWGYFTELLTAEVERCHRYDRCLSVLLFDLDHFKKVNDTHGHAAGDEALRTFVGTLQNSGLRENDFCGRLGGEEFALALAETGMAAAMIPAERIRSRLEAALIRCGAASFSITVSIGISQYQPGDSIETLLGRADRAMYEAKQAGRNRICQASAS